MTRYKTHLIAVKKFNDKEDMIMQDIRDAMEYLAIMMTRHNSLGRKSRPSTRTPLANPSPATHIYCYEAKVVPFPNSHTQ